MLLISMELRVALARQGGAFGKRDVECDAILRRDGARDMPLARRVLGEQDVTWTEPNLPPTFQFDLALAAQSHDELPPWRRVPVEEVLRRRTSQLQPGDGD